MKIQIGANAVVANSGTLAKKNPQAIKQALAAPKGKVKMLEITLTDDNGVVCVLSAPLRQFKSGAIGAYLSIKAEARFVVVDGVSASTEAAAKEQDKLAALTAELLG